MTKETWWAGLSKDEQESINHSLFYKKVFDLEVAYSKLGKIIY